MGLNWLTFLWRDNEMSSKIKLRELRFGDFGLLSRIVRKVEVRAEIRELSNFYGKEMTEAEAAVADKRIMAEVILMITDNYEKVEEDLHKLFANLSGEKIDVIKALNITETFDMFKSLGEDPGLPNFLKSALK